MTIINKNTGKFICSVMTNHSTSIEDALDLVFERSVDFDGEPEDCWLDVNNHEILADECLAVYWDEIPESIDGAKLFVVDEFDAHDCFTEYFDDIGHAKDYAIDCASRTLRDNAHRRNKLLVNTISIAAYSITKEQYNDCLDEGDDASTWQIAYYEVLA